MAVLVHSSRIQAPLEAVFEFHLDPANLARIQPPGFGVRKLEVPVRIESGAEIRLAAAAFGWVQAWHVQVEAVLPPHGEPRRAALIDRALASPFPYFRHRHEFMEEGGGTWMRDVVDFDPPGGRIGAWFWPGAWLVMKVMFTWRHRRTRRLLEDGL